MRFDLGLAYIGKASRYGESKFFSVEDLDGEVYVYQNACDESKKEIRNAIYITFIEPWDDQEEPKKVSGQYPNYRIEEVTG